MSHQRISCPCCGREYIRLVPLQEGETIGPCAVCKHEVWEKRMKEYSTIKQERQREEFYSAAVAELTGA